MSDLDSDTFFNICIDYLENQCVEKERSYYYNFQTILQFIILEP
jgi:hypothetical protein